MSKGVVSFDTETRGLNWFESDEQAFLGSWADERGEYSAVLSDPADKARFLSALSQADTLVAHNLSFDVHQVRASTGLDALVLGKELHDTDVMSRVLFPEGQRKDRGGHGLKNLAEVWLRADAKGAEDAIKDMGRQIGLRTLKKKGAYYDVWRAFPETMEHYARMDARYTFDLYKKFEAKLAQSPQAQKIYDLEMAVSPVLIRAEARGVRVDPATVAALQEEWSTKALQLEEQLHVGLGEEALGGEGSDEALREALLKQGIPLHRKTPTGELATNHFALQEFEADYPVVADLFAWRRATKFLSTYIGPMLGRQVVHPSFRQAEAWTGRMSCTRPNMQNLPKAAGKELREMFIPREGHVFVVCDFDSIEVRLLAHYLGSRGEPYRDLITMGHDPHSYMAAQIYGGSMEDYAKDGPNDDKRAKAKHTMFAITYGAGAPRVSDMNKVTKEQAKQMICKIKSGLPGYYQLMKRIRAKIEEQGHVNTLYGRRQLVDPSKSYVGLNSLIQGSAADIMKRGLVNVAAAVEPLGGTPLLVVHDEVVIEVPAEHGQEALAATIAGMRHAASIEPQLEVSGSVVEKSYAHA